MCFFCGGTKYEQWLIQLAGIVLLLSQLAETAAKIRSVCSVLREENSMRNDLHSVETKWKAHDSFTDFSFWIVVSWVFGGKVVLTLAAQKYSHCLKQPVFTVVREEGQKLVR